MNLTCRCGGSPGKSSGKSSGYSLTTRMSSTLHYSAFLSTTWTRKAMHPVLRLFRAFMQLLVSSRVSCFSPCTKRCSLVFRQGEKE
ncbi:hypothetical protein HanPI659440_Chr16g0632561 [Helianthus annuus]|nr:hypothetical protein HanPI659440_Chr16g0632561 [Helianthus annuus]